MLPVKIVAAAAAVEAIVWLTITVLPPFTVMAPPVPVFVFAAADEVLVTVRLTAPVVAVVPPNVTAAPVCPFVNATPVAETVWDLPPSIVRVVAFAAAVFVTVNACPDPAVKAVIAPALDTVTFVTPVNGAPAVLKVPMSS